MISAASILANAAASTSNTVGGCANWVWRMCGAPNDIPHFNTAADLANRSTVRYSTWSAMPVGSIFYLGPLSHPRYAGDTTYMDGDVGFKLDANRVYVSDGAGEGRPGVMTLAEREAQTGRTFQFGFGDLEGLPIDFGTVSTNTGIPTEEEMPLTQADISLLLNFRAFDNGPTISEALKAIYQAVFNGGSSMPDGGRSIGASLASINAQVSRPVQRTIDGKVQTIPQIQDNADTNTMVRQLLAAVGTSSVGLTDAQIQEIAKAVLSNAATAVAAAAQADK